MKPGTIDEAEVYNDDLPPPPPEPSESQSEKETRRATPGYGASGVRGRSMRPRNLALLAKPLNVQTEADGQRGAHLTDTGAAERFASERAGLWLYDYRRRRDLIWRGSRWAPDVDGEVYRLAIASVRSWQRAALDNADRDQREHLLKHAIALERRGGLENLIALARTIKPIADAGDSFDANPFLFGCLDGVVDLKTGERRDGRPEDRITMSAAVPFDPAAGCPRWERFLSEVFDADQALVEFVWRAVGYGLTGSTSEQVLFLLYGVGANGKGTFTNTLARLLGDYAWNLPFATIEREQRASIPNDLAALGGRRFVIASETNDGTRLNEARVKALTGCDPITARFLHGEFFTFQPVAKFFLAVNHKPVVRDDSHGFWRRVRLIPCARTFPVNTTLEDELRAEQTGILAWAVRGCLAWQRDGLRTPAVVERATDDYRADSDPLAAFLDEACEPDDAAEVGAADFYQAYKAWAERAGLSERERLTATTFGRKVSERLCRVKTARGHVYRGIRRK